MSKAKIQGIEVTIYNFYMISDYLVCDVKYPHLSTKVPVLAELIDLEA